MRRLAVLGMALILLASWSGARRPRCTNIKCATCPLAACGGKACCAGLPEIVNGIPKGTLTAVDRQAIRQMWLDTKIFRDASRLLLCKWPLPACDRLPCGEYHHFMAIQKLLAKYGLPEPMAQDVRGAFPRGPARAAFDKLVAAQDTSLPEALAACAQFKECHIVWLRRQAAASSNLDLQTVCRALERADSGQFRLLHAVLVHHGGRYTPVILRPEELAAILQPPDGVLIGCGKGANCCGCCGGRGSCACTTADRTARK
jgi:hypothetical protein